MTQYDMTDREEAEMLKKWWHNYGKKIAIAIIIGSILGFGWHFWRDQQVALSENASTLFDKISVAMGENQQELVAKFSAELIDQYPKTVYATMASFFLAQTFVNKKQYDSALTKLNWVLLHSHVDRFKQIARIRIARILIFQNKPQLALEKLTIVNDNTFQPQIDEVKGEIYKVLKEPELAKKAYQAADKGMVGAHIKSPVVKMELAVP